LGGIVVVVVVVVLVGMVEAGWWGVAFVFAIFGVVEGLGGLGISDGSFGYRDGI
jgi:hypothetical protein